MVAESKTGIPTWAKWLIGVAVVFFLSTAGLIYAGSMFLKNTIEKSRDPVAIEHSADSIATFSKPLPSGFKFDAATEVLNVKTLVISHQPERMLITWTCISVKNSDPMSKSFESGFERGMKGSALGKFVETGSGQLPVADGHLEYRVGYMDTARGKSPLLRGKISNVPDRLIAINAYSQTGADFDMKLFKTFLASVEDLSP